MNRANDIKTPINVGKEVKIRGWVHRLRKQKEKTFILIRDERGGVIQCVFPTQKIVHLTIESSIEVTGILAKDDRAPESGYEIRGSSLMIINIADVDFPIGEYQSAELLLDYRHLTLRTRRMIEIAKIRATILKSAREFFIRDDWMEVTPPIIVKGAVEGGSTLFKLKYFNEEAFLSQSAQLYLEALIFALGPVWSLTPSFRAEKSRTVRHLAEFSHLEAEAPVVCLEEILSVQEKLISYIIHNTVRERSDSLNFLKSDVTSITNINVPFERITYSHAIDTLQSRDFKILDTSGKKRTIDVGDDLNIDSERELTKFARKPLFVTDYPIQIKPFYVKENVHHKGIGLSADLLAPAGFGEIASGGMREDDILSIKKRMKIEGLDPSHYEWYLDLRRFGSVPHGGFGLGIERLLRWLANIEDIKDTVLFPRTMSRIIP